MTLLEIIEGAFENVERPDDKDYTSSKGGEAYEESSEFFGKDWQSLSPSFLEKYRGVLHWFTPEAFQYYLPAFLKTAVATNDQYALYVHTVLFLLRPGPDGHEEFRKARWSRLTEKQIGALRAWLDWLLEKAVSDRILAAEVREALDVLDAQLWW